MLLLALFFMVLQKISLQFFCYNYPVDLLSNSENREHLKNFRNVDCVLANHNKVQDM